MKKNYLYDVYMLCPVRNATIVEKSFLTSYKWELEEKGLKVHYSAETPQEDETGGYRLTMDHCNEILNSKTVHVFWNPESIGSKVDLGSSLIEHRRRGLDVLLMNRWQVEKIVKSQKSKGIPKSYEMVLLHLDSIADNTTRIKFP
jgi:hypothetical protein